MGRRIVALGLSAIMLLGVFLLVACDGLASCNRGYSVHEDGYFQYLILGENSLIVAESNRVIAIVGFTKLGKQQEVIDFPRYIGGIRVTLIGFYHDDFYQNSTVRYGYSEKLRKIYVHDNIGFIYHFDGQEVDVMLCSTNTNIVDRSRDFFKNFYVYKSINHGIDAISANIVFLNNYSEDVNKGYYRIDNIENGEKVPKPPDPERTDFAFTGWYTDANCQTQWDFDSIPTIAEDEEFRLYAGWQPL